MLRIKKESFNHFTQQQTQNIKCRFDHYSQGDFGVDYDHFKKWMGLLGLGQCQFLSKKIYRLIAGRKQHFQFEEFLNFLNAISYGTVRQKAQISFHFLDRNNNGRLEHQDIQEVITQLCLIWNFLTGQKIHPGSALEIICEKLNVKPGNFLTFDQYILRYDQYFSWFDYFNSVSVSKEEHESEQFPIDQIQEYLKFIHSEVANMILELKQPQNQSFSEQDTNLTTDLSIIKGPIHVSSQPFKLKGDIKTRDSFKVQTSEELSSRLENQGFNKFQVMVNKLQQIKKIGHQVLPSFKDKQDFQLLPNEILQKQQSQATMPNLYVRNSIINISQNNHQRKNLVYLGHQSWNIMLNLMLGLRKSYKSHFYFHKQHQKFSSEDLGSKYPYELIFKKKNEQVTQICEIFIDYAPKVFAFARKKFGVENNQILRSLGFQNLLGNLLMGNMSTLSDQTESNYRSESTNFIYYTSDHKVIVQSISKQQSNTLRSILYEYTKYCSQNPDTFLPKIYGLHKLKNESTNRQIYFILYNNAFDLPVKIDLKYELTGDLSNKEKNSISCQFLNDNDLLKNTTNFQLQIQQKKRIYSQIQNDIRFLYSHNITGYRLRIATSKGEIRGLSSGRQSFRSVDMQQTYFFSIFNVLNEYSTAKLIGSKLEKIFSSGVEYLNPKQYKDRFLKFIAKQIFVY